MVPFKKLKTDRFDYNNQAVPVVRHSQSRTYFGYNFRKVQKRHKSKLAVAIRVEWWMDGGE